MGERDMRRQTDNEYGNDVGDEADDDTVVGWVRPGMSVFIEVENCCRAAVIPKQRESSN